ncbi:MAG: CRISPR-associated protein Csc3 [Pseudanabaena sp. CAN_BIN31]|nr:CRISPR-associated protein Csc3 [Pseudanabaena sp. CAN_BIN31]
MSRLLGRSPKTLEERYFSEIRPEFYKVHGNHHQYGVRKGTTLAQHFDSACQFVLTVSRIAGIPEDKRRVLLAATAVHDLNKLDDNGRNVKTLARNREFLEQEFERVGVSSLIQNDQDLELARKLIERHSGHNASDGALFLPEDPIIRRIAAILIAADLFDLGIAEKERFRKIENELTVAFGRTSKLFKVSVSQDRGYITALLLGACEEVLAEKGLATLSIFPDSIIFEGRAFPTGDLAIEMAARWQFKIDSVFGGNIDQLVKATKDGIKISAHAVQHNLDEVLGVVQAQLEKKKAGFKLEKVRTDVRKWGAEKAGEDALVEAADVGLLPVDNAEEFGLSEALKSAYLSYRQVQPELSTAQVWDAIAKHTGLSKEQRLALEPFDAQYARSLFAAKALTNRIDGAIAALRDSLELRKNSLQDQKGSDVSEEIIDAVNRTLNWQMTSILKGSEELEAYINANPRQRCSLGATYGETEDVASMPIGTKVQVFSNRLPAGMNGDPRRQADPMTSLGYQLMTVGACFPAVKKDPPYYLHLSLPKGSCPELLRIWRDWLEDKANTNGDGGTVSVDQLQLYRDNVIHFQSNKVVGFAFPKRPDFVHANVVLPLTAGDTNASLALIKSLRLALEISLAPDFGFPFILSSGMQVETMHDGFGRVEGIPSSFSGLLGSGNYTYEEALEIRDRLRCLGKLALAVASLNKLDDCFYDLARATTQPFSLYYVLLRWILREQDKPNLATNWSRIREPLYILLESLMPEQNNTLTVYLKEATLLAAEAKIWGSSYERTSSIEPFAAMVSAIRGLKSHMPLDVVFGALVQSYHTRLDRIREHGVGNTKFEQIKNYYAVLRSLYEDVYQSKPEKFLADQKTLEAAYLFFLEEARRIQRAKTENENNQKIV